MKEIIIGGSNSDYSYTAFSQYYDKILGRLEFDSVTIVGGGANGVDRMGEKYAKSREYRLRIFLADWNQYGKAAGPIKNKQMAEYADGLTAFWDGRSPETGNMISTARSMGLKIRLKRYT